MGKASSGLETILKLDFIKMEDSTFVFFSLRREIMSGARREIMSGKMQEER